MNRSTISRTLARVIRLSAVAALLTGLLAITQPARATTFTVMNTNNGGPGSLRRAINDAHSHPGADIITFDPATNGNPIVLAGAPGDDFNASGDLDILNGGDLTIQGNGAANTIIDGGGIDRVFHICPSGGCANTVILSGVTIRNGVVAVVGGGIYNKGATTVDGSTVRDNTAGDAGGGIYNVATLNVQNGSTIGGAGAGNFATNDGGGIYNSAGMTTVDGSTISANMAKAGGGIYNEATLNVQNGSTVSANTADYGGGIYNYDGTTTVDGSTISANTAVGTGGGIYNWATLNVHNGSTIGANTANDHGGGIYNYDGTTTVDGSTVSANTAGWGGGIYNWSGTTTVDGSTVSANTVHSDGGGIYNKATLNVQNGSTIGGAGAGNTAISGGGIFNSTGTTTVTSSRILNNTATTNGGGVFNNWDSAGATSVTGSFIVGNSATSFFNNQPAQQIATCNWWGAAAGPNTTGADTVSGNVDTSGHLTEPILGCGFYVYLPLVLK